MPLKKADWWAPGFLFVMLGLAGCGGTEEIDDSYRDAKTVKRLELPADLQTPRGLNELSIPNIKVDDSYTKESLLELEKPPQVLSSVDLALLEKGGTIGSKTSIDASPAGTTEQKPPTSTDGAVAAQANSGGNPEVALVNEGSQSRKPFSAEASTTPDGTKILTVNADFNSVWPVVGDALKELGFSIEDSSRGNRIYAISKELPEIEFDMKKPHPGDEKEAVQEEFQVHLKEVENTTQLTVHNKYGKLEGSGLADHLLLQIKSIIEDEK